MHACNGGYTEPYFAVCNTACIDAYFPAKKTAYIDSIPVHNTDNINSCNDGCIDQSLTPIIMAKDTHIRVHSTAYVEASITAHSTGYIDPFLPAFIIGYMAAAIPAIILVI
jgi:hypothetical protein